jgi:hypothetical protein
MVGIYRKSPLYQRLSKRVRSNYEYGLAIASNHPIMNDPCGRLRFGQLSLGEITPGIVDKLYAKVKVDREPLAGTKGEANSTNELKYREIPRLRRGQEVIKACRRAWNVAQRSEPDLVSKMNPFEDAEIEAPKAGKTVPATWKQTLAFVQACDEAGAWSIGTASLVSFLWFQRQEHIMGVPREDGRTTGLLWADYRPEENNVTIRHPKTNEVTDLPLYSEDGKPLFPELMDRLNNATKRGSLICLRDQPDKTGVYRPWPTRGNHAALATFIRQVAKIRDNAGLPKEITFRSFRHGGFTFSGDADLSDADVNAVGAKTDATLNVYRKGTLQQKQRALKRMLDQRSNQQRLSTSEGEVCPPRGDRTSVSH